MKRIFIFVILISSALMITGISNATYIDIISQTYNIHSFGFDVTSSMPIEKTEINTEVASGVVEAGGYIGTLSASLNTFVSSGYVHPFSSSATLVFRPIGASFMDISLDSGIMFDRDAGTDCTLMDVTTGVSLYSMSWWNWGNPPSPHVEFRIPILPSDTYSLSISSYQWEGVTSMQARLSVVPEPTIILLLGFGLIGLIVIRHISR